MTIDPDKLLRFPIPSVRQRISPKDVAFYALSIGIGYNPLDKEQVRFVDPLAGPTPVPSMVLVLAHPGFWLGDPQSGVDPVAVLHASQAFELSGPVPTQGEVESHTKISAIVDKGPGKPALIYTETELLNENGAQFARLDRTTFIRNGGGFGGSQEAPVTKASLPPTTKPDMIVELETRPEQALIYRLNGDLNPLHSDVEIAARSGFERPILHGLCTMGVVTHALLKSLLDYKSETLASMGMKFAAPVMPGETIRTEIWKSGEFRARSIERDIIVADQGWCTIASGDAQPRTHRKEGNIK